MNKDIELGPIKEGEFAGKRIVITANSVVKYGDEMLPLCSMCQFSRMTCENDYVRDIAVPLEPGDVPGIMHRRQPDGTMKEIPMDFKTVDGVAAGIILSEEDIPIPFVCEWFKPKSG